MNSKVTFGLVLILTAGLACSHDGETCATLALCLPQTSATQCCLNISDCTIDGGAQIVEVVCKEKP